MGHAPGKRRASEDVHVSDLSPFATGDESKHAAVSRGRPRTSPSCSYRLRCDAAESGNLLTKAKWERSQRPPKICRAIVGGADCSTRARQTRAVLGGRAVKPYQGPRCGHGTTWRQIRSPVLHPGSPGRPMTPWAFPTQLRRWETRKYGSWSSEETVTMSLPQPRCWQQLANQSPNIE